MRKTLDAKTCELLAKISHEVNRAYCQSIGDDSQLHWEGAPEWQRDSARKGVVGAILGNNTPEQSHESWMAEKRQDGWVFGEVKDPARKTHPCMVPYADLPPEQRLKDQLFTAVVRTVAELLQAK